MDRRENEPNSHLVSEPSSQQDILGKLKQGIFFADFPSWITNMHIDTHRIACTSLKGR